MMYQNGEGVNQSYTEAFKWFTKAANQGHAQAQFNLGVHGSPKNVSYK